MKKLITYLIILFLFSVPTFGFAATYYAQGAGEITAVQWDTSAGGGGTDLIWGNLANGDVLDANSYAISIANNVGSSGVAVTLKNDTAAGGFTVDISAVAALTLYTSLTTGTATCLSISGAGSAGTELTIIGTIAGGTAASASGVADTHTGAGANIVVQGDITGGTNATARGYYFTGSTGVVVITGNATASVGAAVYTSSGGTASITGNCIAGSHASSIKDSAGCVGGGAGTLTIVGSIINSEDAVGVIGNITWNPTAPSNGVTGHYIQFVGGDDVFVGKNTDDASLATVMFYYIDPTDGTSDVGTASDGGSGGSYGF
jgi:hypothetical protein